MEYSLGSFADRLREMMYVRFPYESDELNKKKHPKREGHIRDVAFMNLPLTIENDLISFDIGDYNSEATHPYYHILQQAPVIRKRGRASDKTRGSQAKITDFGSRDYEKVSWNGKTFTKEYSRNVRGSRKSVIKNATRVYHSGGKTIKVNREANSYVNTHYQYIDRMLEDITISIANEFDMKLAKRKIDTGLGEEYFSQLEEPPTNILDIIGSFEE